MQVEKRNSELHRILHFDDDDLSANRNGKFSPRQKCRFSRDRRLTIGYSLGGSAMILVFLLISAADNLGDLIAYVFGAGLLLLTPYLLITGARRDLRKIDKGRKPIRAASGELSRDVDHFDVQDQAQDGLDIVDLVIAFLSPSRFLVLGNRRFRVSKRVQHAFEEEQAYVLSFVEFAFRGAKILCAERIDASRLSLSSHGPDNECF